MNYYHWACKGQRKAWSEALFKLGGEYEDIVVVTADLSTSVGTTKFRKKYPLRHFNVGIAEQNMISIAAGLASSGKIVFATTFAAFGTGRVYDQIRQSVAYPNLNVKIIATHGGITVGGDGATHQMIEDFALIRALPNMRVIVPADGLETFKAIHAMIEPEWKGPFYLRMGRVDVPEITKDNDKFVIGKASILKRGKDITLIGTGITVSRCLRAYEILQEDHGIGASIINMSTLKPIDKKAIINAAKRTGAIVTAEEHTIMGGLGSAVASVVCENCPVPMKMIGIEDKFGESGESIRLMERFGLTEDNIVKAALELKKKKK